VEGISNEEQWFSENAQDEQHKMVCNVPTRKAILSQNGGNSLAIMKNLANA
jgi:hypothetical protein